MPVDRPKMGGMSTPYVHVQKLYNFWLAFRTVRIFCAVMNIEFLMVLTETFSASSKKRIRKLNRKRGKKSMRLCCHLVSFLRNEINECWKENSRFKS